MLSWGGSATWNIMSKDVTICPQFFLSDGHMFEIEDDPKWNQPALLWLVISLNTGLWLVSWSGPQPSPKAKVVDTLNSVPFFPISEWSHCGALSSNWSNLTRILASYWTFLPHIRVVMRKLTVTWDHDGEGFKQWQYKILLIISTNKTKPSLKWSRLQQFQTHHDDSVWWAILFYAFLAWNMQRHLSHKKFSAVDARFIV